MGDRVLWRRLAFLVACGCLGVTVSCAAILGFEPLSEEGAPDAAADTVDTGASDGGVDASAEDLCSRIGIPDEPDATGGTSLPPLLGALRLLDFGIEIAGGSLPPAPGLNLDLVCSKDLATSSCTVKLLPTAFDEHAKDKNLSTGIDNAGFGLVQKIGSFSEVFNARTFNSGVTEGKYGAVVRISRWNGLPNDDDVLLEIFPTFGFEPFLDDGGVTPRFTEDDVWKLDKRFQLVGGVEGSTIASHRAWVTNGRLVARFSTVTIPIAIENDPKPFDVIVRDAIITGTIGADVPLSDGVIAGRWKTSDFLDQLKKIYILDTLDIEDTLLCESSAALLYAGIKSEICSARDIRSDSRDNQNLPCDAVSAGARIETYRIKTLGDFVPSFNAGPRCQTGADVPIDDDCK